MTRLLSHLFFVATFVVAATASTREAVTYTIDPDASRVRIHVGKSGLFSFVGHTHEVAAPAVSGTVVLNAASLDQSSVRVLFDATAFKVTGEGEPAGDVPEVQQTMESARVLDVQRFPRVNFVSKAVRVTGRDGERVRLRIDGDLTLHGVTRMQRLDVMAGITPDRIAATGIVTVKQTQFGIEPVTAGAGTVRVKDDVDVEFSIVAIPEAVARP